MNMPGLPTRFDARGASCIAAAAIAGLNFHQTAAGVLVALALLLLIRALMDATILRAGVTGALFALAFYGAGFSWLWTGAAAGFEPYLAALWAFAAVLHATAAGLMCALLLLPAVPHWLRFGLLLPSLWVLSEWLMQQGTIAVPWLALGHAFVDVPPFTSLLPYGGTLLVTWVVLALLGLCACLFWQARHRSALRLAVGALAGLVAMTQLAAVAWTTRLSQSVSVSALTSGVSSNDKYIGGKDAQRFRELAGTALASRSELVVLPETLVPQLLSALSPAELAAWSERLRSQGQDLLLGTFIPEGSQGAYYSGAISLGMSGMQAVRKHRLMPFGEFVPMGDSLFAPIKRMLSIPMLDTRAATAISPSLVLAGGRVAAPICYEAAFGNDVRLAASDAGFVTTLADDAWNSSPRYHAQARKLLTARALELQKPVMRVTNAGPSYWIAADGNVNDIDEAAFGITPHEGLTPYGAYGDLPVLAISLCLLLVLTIASLRFRRGVRRKTIVTVPSPQAGQALPAAVVFMLIMSGTLYLMANSGQLVTEKIRVTNAADAAAYSAGLVQARAMNYDAYTNRAMIANQIAIAQYVSFASWVNYFGSGTENVWVGYGDATSFIWNDLVDFTQVSTVAGVFGVVEIVSVYFTGNSVPDWINEYLPYMGWIIAAHNVAGMALSASQDVLHTSLLAGYQHSQVADDVVKKMDSKLDATVIPGTALDMFTKRYSGNERGRMADVVIRSRDDFTRERRWTADTGDIPLVSKDVAVKRRGGTDLIDFDQWRAVDTLEVHGRHFGCGKLGTSWCSDVKTPMAYSGADVSATGDDLGAGYHGGAYADNETSAELAEDTDRYWTSSSEFENAVSGMPLYNGIRPSRELRNPDNQVVGISVMVSKNQSDTLTSGNAALAKPSGRLNLFEGEAEGGKIISLARAEVFFDRTTPRADGRAEVASLFNPYWRVRLVAPTAADKAYAASQQGGAFLP